MSIERWWSLLAGLGILGFGLHAIVTRRVVFGDDDEGERLWVYGWRAVSIGLAALFLAGIFFAQAADWIPSFN